MNNMYMSAKIKFHDRRDTEASENLRDPLLNCGFLAKQNVDKRHYFQT